MKCTKIYNARTQLLFCSLNLLFSDVPVVVAVVVFLNSLLAYLATVCCFASGFLFLSFPPDVGLDFHRFLESGPCSSPRIGWTRERQSMSVT